MIDILLINAASPAKVYQGLADEFSAIEPPSLAAMFATYLRRKGCSVAILDCPATSVREPDQPIGLNAWQAANMALDYKATLYVMVVYGFQPSASTQNMTFAGEMCRYMKQIDQNHYPVGQCKILMTGTHPAALPERTLREEAIDYVCDSEGPQTILTLLRALKQLNGQDASSFVNIAGLWYKFHSMPMKSPPAFLLDHLTY